MKNKASINVQIPLSLFYYLIYQGEASSLKGSFHSWVRWCVPIQTPSPYIYRPEHRHENTPSTDGMCLGSTKEMTRGWWERTTLKWGQPTFGVIRSRVSSDHTAFRLGDCQVGPQGDSRCMGQLKAFWSDCGPLNPCVEHVAASDSWGSASLWYMRCHGHMASCVSARRHEAWCGYHRAHMMSCAYLSYPSSDVCKWYNHFERLDEIVTMVQSKWAFGTVSIDVKSAPHAKHTTSRTS
jgi:hypothetical protein